VSKAEFFVTPGYGERQLRLFHYSQAVKVGDRLEISGQGGWNDDWEFPESIKEEIAQAFRNVERTLAVAGAGWGHVIHVNSYHVGLDEETNRVMTEQFRHYMPALAHVQTAVGPFALEQNVQPLALQRVEWMGDHQRTGRRPVRRRIMR
jgi:enamine deaminase RidA (YjgF/YER057c/UK114 family)